MSSHRKLRFVQEQYSTQILKERRCFICLDLMEQDLLEWVL